MRAQQSGRTCGVIDLGARVGCASTAVETSACQMGTISRSVQIGDSTWEQVRPRSQLAGEGQRARTMLLIAIVSERWQICGRHASQPDPTSALAQLHSDGLDDGGPPSMNLRADFRKVAHEYSYDVLTCTAVSIEMTSANPSPN